MRSQAFAENTAIFSSSRRRARMEQVSRRGKATWTNEMFDLAQAYGRRAPEESAPIPEVNEAELHAHNIQQTILARFYQTAKPSKPRLLTAMMNRWRTRNDDLSPCMVAYLQKYGNDLCRGVQPPILTLAELNCL